MQLEIRLVVKEDSEELLQIYRYYIENTAITFETATPTVDAFAKRVENISSVYPYLVCLADNKIAGYAYASINRERAAYAFNVDTSIYIQEKYHGCGIGDRLYRALLAILSALGYVNVYACITLPNLKSQRFHEKHGFTHVAVFRKTGYKSGAWHDVGWYEKQLRPHEDTPCAVKKIGELTLKELQNILLSIS